MDEHEDLRQRLRALGTQPIEPTLQSAHLTMLAAAGRRSLRPKLRTAGVFLAGLLVGGSGLAAAGALPDPAQHAAHRVLDEVGIQVPDPERYHGPECGEVKRNHGAYVREDKGLARTDCGKPVGGGKDEVEGEDELGEPGAERAAKGPCQGPPPWAGANKSSLTNQQKAAAQAERAAQCGGEDAAEEKAEEDDADTGSKAPEAATTTTTTTTTPADPPTTVSETTTTVAG